MKSRDDKSVTYHALYGCRVGFYETVNLALGLANKGYKVGLMDVDLHGPDICHMFNLTEKLQATQTDGRYLFPPMQYGENLKVISLEYMMEDRDDPIIWRGPLKVQAIRQFIADMDWGELDYLIIDAPPGTGDESMEIFKTGGGEKTAKEFGIDFLGRVPFDHRVVMGGDDGKPYLSSRRREWQTIHVF